MHNVSLPPRERERDRETLSCQHTPVKLQNCLVVDDDHYEGTERALCI